MDITTLALAKKFAKEYTDTHSSKLTEEDAIRAVANYFDENPNAIVTDSELSEKLENYIKLNELADWAKEKSKPSYTAAEVGALSDKTTLFSGDYNDLQNQPVFGDGFRKVNNNISIAKTKKTEKLVINEAELTTNNGLISRNIYPTSTFSGWSSFLGITDISKIEAKITVRELCPVTKVFISIYRCLFLDDLKKIDPALTPEALETGNVYISSRVMFNNDHLLFNKTLDVNWTDAGLHSISCLLDNPIENNKDNLILFIGCDNRVTMGISTFNAESSLITSTLDYNPWCYYIVNGYDPLNNKSISPLYSKQHDLYNTKKQFIIVRDITIWKNEYSYLNLEGIVKEQLSDTQTLIQTIETKADTADTKAETALNKANQVIDSYDWGSFSDKTGYSPDDIVTEDLAASQWNKSNLTSTFTGVVQCIGHVPADMKIEGIAMPLCIRQFTEGNDLQQTVTSATKARVFLYTVDKIPFSSDKSSFESLSPTLLAAKEIDIDLNTTEHSDTPKVYTFIFDQPVYNTGNKMMMLGYYMNGYTNKVFSTKSDHIRSLLKTIPNEQQYEAAYSNNYSNDSFESFYHSISNVQNGQLVFSDSLYDPQHWHRVWSNDKPLLWSFITPSTKYIFADELDNKIISAINSKTENLKNEIIIAANQLITGVVKLAKKYILVKGDTFQLFYDGVIKTTHIENLNITTRCSVGAQYPRYWEFTPLEEHVGKTYKLKLYVRDLNGNILSSGETDIEIVDVPKYDSETSYDILCFGDSLTSGGAWVCEGLRRLVGTETNGVSGPESLRVPNLNLHSYGKKHSKINTYTAAHEGYGGWTWGSFLAASNTSSTTNGIFVTLKNPIDWELNTVQKTIWTDNNNLKWELEDFQSTSIIKFNRGVGNSQSQSSTMLPTELTCSTLDLVIGTEDIVDTAWESGNPFFDNATNRVNLLAHAEELGSKGADIVACLLTWNSGGGGASATPSFTGNINNHMANATTLLRDIHRDLPNAKIICLGIPLSSITGGNGSNYGANGGYADSFGTRFYAMEYNEALEKLVTNDEFSTYCYYVDTKGQFDSKYNLPHIAKAVNTRNSMTELFGTNGVHPSTEGYYQIGDAFFRGLVKVLNDIY